MSMLLRNTQENENLMQALDVAVLIQRLYAVYVSSQCFMYKDSLWQRKPLLLIDGFVYLRYTYVRVLSGWARGKGSGLSPLRSGFDLRRRQARWFVVGLMGLLRFLPTVRPSMPRSEICDK